MALMKSVVIHGKGDYRWEDLPVPVPGENEVLVKVEAVGICAGDAKTYIGAERFWGEPSYTEPPVTPGHEFSGRVVALGPGADKKHGVTVGDLAVAEHIVPCEECRYCKRGNYQMCVPHDVFGWHQASKGAMAEYMIYPAKSIVHKIPDGIPAHHAAYVEPVACAVHAVELGNIRFNDVVVVSGCGPIGLGVIAATKLKNPTKIIALDPNLFKLALAKRCGADITLQIRGCDLKQEINKLTGGFGCDVYIETAGKPESIKQGLEIIARMGRFVEFSVFDKEASADWSIISDTKELTIVGGHLAPYCWPRAIQMIKDGLLPVEDIITHRLPLRDFLTGIEMVLGKRGKGHVKVMLIP